jgi:hypothetical protein
MISIAMGALVIIVVVVGDEKNVDFEVLGDRDSGQIPESRVSRPPEVQKLLADSGQNWRMKRV